MVDEPEMLTPYSIEERRVHWENMDIITKDKHLKKRRRWESKLVKYGSFFNSRSTKDS